MPNFYYTDTNGQKQGAISPSQLKELVAQGIITPDTLLETDNGHKGKAGQIKGLFPHPSSAPVLADNQTVSQRVSTPDYFRVTEKDKRVILALQDCDYRHIAELHRLSTWSILLYIPFLCLGMVLFTWGMDSGSPLGVLLGLCGVGLMIGAVIFSITCMVRLARALRYGIGAIVVFTIMLPLGGLGLIPLCCVYLFAGHFLKLTGHKAGFIGTDMQQFDDDDD